MKKGKYEKHSSLQKFPCLAVIEAARTGVHSFPFTPCNGIILPLISSFKNDILRFLLVYVNVTFTIVHYF